MDADLRRLEAESGWNYCSHHGLMYAVSQKCPRCAANERQKATVTSLAVVPKPAAQPQPIEPEPVAEPQPAPPPPLKLVDEVIPAGRVAFTEVQALVDKGMASGKWRSVSRLLAAAGFDHANFYNWRIRGSVKPQVLDKLRAFIEKAEEPVTNDPATEEATPPATEGEAIFTTRDYELLLMGAMKLLKTSPKLATEISELIKKIATQLG